LQEIIIRYTPHFSLNNYKYSVFTKYFVGVVEIYILHFKSQHGRFTTETVQILTLISKI